MNIQTRAAPDAQQLLYVLVTGISSLIRELEESYKPALRLVIIDTLAEVFHTSTRTTTASLVERSQTLGLASTALHTLASTHNLSILVLNEVSDVFADYQSGELGELIYRDHARWFSRAEGVPGIEMKEAALGLAWANQPNARIMLSRTERRRYLDLPTSPVAKRRRLSLDPELNMDDMDVVGANGPTLVRRLTVLFSSVSPPAALDYIVTTAGVSTLPSVEDFPLADVDARSDVFDLDAAEEEDLLNALAEVEGRTQAAVADTLKPPDSGVVEAVVLDPLEPPDSEGVEEAESDPLGDTVVDQLAEPLEDDDFFVGDEMTLDEEDLLALEDGPSVEAFPQAAE